MTNALSFGMYKPMKFNEFFSRRKRSEKMQLTPFCFSLFSHSDCPACGQFGSLLQKRWLAFQYSLFDAAV